ncbi:helix-turn-helix domain-containing protein [bacterium]|nr:helix-turn-helix domain-containing protein [bacterium]
MANETGLENSVREHRVALGWSQEELAARAGISRAGLSAIEVGRLVPSVAASLAIASALGCRVEDLFRIAQGEGLSVDALAWLPPGEDEFRCHEVEIGGMRRLFPVEASPQGIIGHDGIVRSGQYRRTGMPEPEKTLIMATCDPAANLLGETLLRHSGVRLLSYRRSSRVALEMLRQGLVHVAGLHLAKATDPAVNASAVRSALGRGYTILRMANWEEGIAFQSGAEIPATVSKLRDKLRWVGREPGSGARQCLDELLEMQSPRSMMLAGDHQAVAAAVRNGWADAGICLKIVGAESSLKFRAVREEAYDVCFPTAFEHDPRIQALLQVSKSAGYRRLISELPGYDSKPMGELSRS